MQKVITKNVATLHERNAIKKFQIQARVRRFTTDSNGIILNNAAVPVDQRKAYPFHLFGDFDRNGGYNIAAKVTDDDNYILLSTFVYGVGQPFWFAAPFANVLNYLNKGDIIFVYVDDLAAPNYFHHIVITAQIGGFASLVAQSNISQIDDNGQWGVFQTKFIDMSFGDVAQIYQPFFMIATRFDGSYRFDAVDPSMFYNTEQKQDSNVVRVPMEILLNQYIGLSSRIDFNNPYVNLIFTLFL